METTPFQIYSDASCPSGPYSYVACITGVEGRLPVLKTVFFGPPISISDAELLGFALGLLVFRVFESQSKALHVSWWCDNEGARSIVNRLAHAYPQDHLKGGSRLVSGLRMLMEPMRVEALPPQPGRTIRRVDACDRACHWVRERGIGSGWGPSGMVARHNRDQAWIVLDARQCGARLMAGEVLEAEEAALAQWGSFAPGAAGIIET